MMLRHHTVEPRSQLHGIAAILGIKIDHVEQCTTMLIAAKMQSCTDLLRSAADHVQLFACMPVRHAEALQESEPIQCTIRLLQLR